MTRARPCPSSPDSIKQQKPWRVPRKHAAGARKMSAVENALIFYVAFSSRDGECKARCFILYAFS